jgi:hypothetical protein
MKHMVAQYSQVEEEDAEGDQDARSISHQGALDQCITDYFQSIVSVNPKDSRDVHTDAQFDFQPSMMDRSTED